MSKEYTGLLQSLLGDGYSITKVAFGESMLPSIPAEVMLSIEPVSRIPPRLGDVVLIVLGDGITKIHRVALLFRLNAAMWVQTWGDNCQKPDPPVRLDDVLGRVVAMKVDDAWRPIQSRWKSYSKYFFMRYGLYYLRKTLRRMRLLL